jgi:protoporphyrin/coproporphyrin ferrochelatase
MFPQFSYATTGSIARFFSDRLSAATLSKIGWVGSFCSHPAYIQCMQQIIEQFLHEHHLVPEKIALLFSAHGVPRSFVKNGDPYQRQCEDSFAKIASAFPQALSRLSYQSKFGPGEWLRPYTQEVCEQILSWNKDRKQVVVVPLSFTSDHLETLVEIEELYLPLITRAGLQAYRCPALNLRADWIRTILDIVHHASAVSTESLIRKK